jgi:hypothetical protein
MPFSTRNLKFLACTAATPRDELLTNTAINYIFLYDAIYPEAHRRNGRMLLLWPA